MCLFNKKYKLQIGGQDVQFYNIVVMRLIWMNDYQKMYLAIDQGGVLYSF